MSYNSMGLSFPEIYCWFKFRRFILLSQYNDRKATNDLILQIDSVKTFDRI